MQKQANATNSTATGSGRAGVPWAAVVVLALLVSLGAPVAPPQGERGAGSSPPVARAASSFFVDPTGSDLNGCTNPGTDKCKTVQRALQVASNGDTIFLAAGTYPITSTIVVTKSVVIQGTGTFSGSGSVLDGGGSVQVMQITAGTTVTLSLLAIQNGSTATFGAGISNAGSLTLDRVRLSNNVGSPTSSGGALYASGPTTISRSTLNANFARAGGAISSEANAPVTIVTSTLSGNSAVTGGAIFNGGPLTIVHSTLAGNTATTFGTIAANNQVRLAGTILSDTGCSIPATAFTSGGYNLATTGSSTCLPALGTGDAVVTVAALGLAALSNNSGPTETQAITAASAAYAQIPPGWSAFSVLLCPSISSSSVIDQRGFVRPGTPRAAGTASCDKGAFEVVAAEPCPPTIVCTPTPTPTRIIEGTPTATPCADPTTGLKCTPTPTRVTDFTPTPTRVTDFTPTPTFQGTRTPTATPTRSVSIPCTPTPTRTPTIPVTATPTRTPNPNATPTPTPRIVNPIPILINPIRLIDTRCSPAFSPLSLRQGERGGRLLAAGSTSRFQIAGVGGIPSGIVGVMLNVTVVQANAAPEGFVTVFPGDVPDSQRPNISTVNPANPIGPNPGIAANFTQVRVPSSGPDAGSIKVYSTNDIELILDVYGYYLPDQGAAATGRAGSLGNIRFVPPVRVLDTRPTDASQVITTTGFLAGSTTTITPGPFSAGETRTYQIGGRSFTTGGTTVTFPADTSAIIAHVTLIGGQGGGFVTLFPGGSSVPATSTANPTTPIAFNSVVVGLGSGPNAGTLGVFVQADIHLAIDVVGYFAPSNPPTIGGVELVTPFRVLDTRPTSPPDAIVTIGYDAAGNALNPGTTTPIGSEETRRFFLSGKSFSGGSIPPDTKGIIANVTTVLAGASSPGGFVTAFPGDIPDSSRPGASTVNPVRTVSFGYWENGLLPPDGSTPGAGTEAIFYRNGPPGSNRVHVLIDVLGYYR